MAKYVPTKEQSAIIEHSGSALLVSAAAGSGKTKVLVERLLRMVCDPVSPCNVDDFLIITYTKAAAEELRSRIASEIGARLAEDSNNRHLRNQLTRIYLAQISTVHSFCSGILRDYAYLLDIPADFRVAETSECDELRQRAMEQVLQRVYEELENRTDVVSFFDSLGRGRDDRRVITLVLAAYDKIQCHVDPQQWVSSCRAAITGENMQHISDSVWAKYLVDDMVSFLQQQIERVQYTKSMIAGNSQFEKYIPVLDDDEALMRSLLHNPSWQNYCNSQIVFTRLPVIKNCEDPQLQAEFKNIRDTYKAKLAGHMKRFSCDENTALSDLKKTGKVLLGLLSIVENFQFQYAELKRKHRVLDFSDLEHFSIRLLTDLYTKKPTSTAVEIGARYREVMIDEYQDSNQVQDTIFRAVSHNGENLFMVGDVKQSIYSFRLADPGIFLDKYHKYESMDYSDGKTPRKILLSANFRSRNDVLDAVNHVFRTVMSEQVGDLEYGEAESLRTILDYPPVNEPVIELHCIDSTVDSDESESLKKRETEANFVAKRIKKLIQEEHFISDGPNLRRIKAEDIVIIMRSVSGNASVYMKALAEQGIVSNCDRTGNILETTEVSTVLAWLQIIDNPHQDIPLITALASPLGGFSADDLAKLRVNNRGMDLYDSLVSYAACDERFNDFLSLLSDLRDALKWSSLHEFFDYVCSRIRAFEIFGAMPDGAVRMGNLDVLRTYFLSRISNGTNTLNGFLRHVEHLRVNDMGIETAVQHGGGVTIMTVHKSKGLEFPVVFLCDLSRKFNVSDISEPVLFDKDLYIGSNVFDRELMLQYPSVAKNAIVVKKRRDLLSEELRVLYVAMTRAKDRLIMTYCSAGMEKQLDKITSSASYPLQPCVSGDVQNPGQWILYSAAVRPEAGCLFKNRMFELCDSASPWTIRYHEGVESDAATKTEEVHECTDSNESYYCVKRLYSYEKAVKIPAKLTATRIKGRGLDVESSEQAAHDIIPQRPLVRPRVFSPSSKALTATQKGVAVHLFMQYCRYENCLTREGILLEKNRLKEKAFLTQEQYDAVSEDTILRFFESEIGRFVTNHSDVHREFKFSLLADAKDYFPDVSGENIMLQGVVDCFVVTSGGIVVLDYKTDNIRSGEEQRRTEEYKPQLMAYSKALERIYDCPVIKRIVYYFHTGNYVEV